VKLAIVGSREWTNPEAVAEWIDGFLDGFEGILISGGAPGIDTWAQEACERRGVTVEVIRPRWHREDGSYNKAAGFERNEEIIKASDEVVVVWNGTSKGSKNDIDLALRYRKKLEVHFPEAMTYSPAPARRLTRRKAST
jgi:hypothetical protein